MPTNNSLNNASSTNVASQTRILTVSNSNNTGSSAAQMNISVGGGSTTGDPQTSYIVSAVDTWSMGVDNSDSDSFVISKNAALGTFNSQRITVNGVNTFPLQPSFLAIPTSDRLNATGTTTPATVGQTVGYTVIFDKSSGISGTEFSNTTPGQYMLMASVTLSNCLINTGAILRIRAGGPRGLIKTIRRPASSTDLSISLCGIISITGPISTFWVTIAGLGESTARNTIVGGTADVKTFFAGYLMG